MCLPYGCLKCFVQVEGWLTFVIGILAIVASIIITVIQHSFDSALKDLNMNDSAATSIVVLFWIFAIIVIFFAVCGLYGAKMKNKCLLAVFNVGNVCLFLAFFSIAILAYIFGSVFKDDTCKINQSDVNMEDLYTKAQATLCKTSCKCYYSQERTSEVESAVKNFSPTDDSLPVKAQDCPGFNQDDKVEASSLAWFEEQFQCSGWCIPYPIQLFHNVNSKVKNYNNPCYKAMVNYFQSIFSTTGTILLCFAILFGMMCILTCCLCCHPKNSNRGQDFYTRLAYTTD